MAFCRIAGRCGAISSAGRRCPVRAVLDWLAGAPVSWSPRQNACPLLTPLAWIEGWPAGNPQGHPRRAVVGRRAKSSGCRGRTVNDILGMELVLVFFPGFRKTLNHPVLQERWEQVTRAALTLVFYLPESLWPYLPLLGNVLFTGIRIPLPAGLWLGWGFLATLRAAGRSGLSSFLTEALIIFAAIFCGSFSRRQERAGRQPLGTGFFSLILLPMVALGLFQAAAGPAAPAPPSWLDPRQRGVVPFRITGMLDNPNLFGMVLAFIFPLLLSAIIRTERGMGYRRLFYLFSGFLHTAALLFTFSRTAWLAAAVALLVFQGREWKNLILPLATLSLFIFLIFPPLRARLDPPGGLWGDSTVAYRRQIWEASWELFKANPLGTGSGGFRRAFLQQRFPAVHAHNQLLHIAVEEGIPGVLLFCWVAYLGLSGPVKTAGQRGVRAALCGQLAAGLTESPWANPLLLFLFWYGWAFLREAADG